MNRPCRRFRSIPAGAGEPARRWSSIFSTTVYPRGCGGTGLDSLFVAHSVGLSPRVRGNRFGLLGVCIRSGSIPAGAGEPSRTASKNAQRQVYPRGCGGTGRGAVSGMSNGGLSPRVRGNPHIPDSRAYQDGSIPAGAGEPRGTCIRCRLRTVYPRGCGGTRSSRNSSRRSAGLSPRVRGNRRARSRAWPRSGSIPAGAGEPTSSRRSCIHARVYPRGCGGTSC